MTSQRKQTRHKKQNSGSEREIKGKFQEQRDFISPVSAKTSKQKEYLKSLYDPSVQIIICKGIFGVGKTYLASCVAADLYRQGKINEIIVARPYVQTGKTSGFKPGTTYEKLFPYVRNVLDTIKSRLGAGAYATALGDTITGNIQVQEVESIRGRSFDKPSFLIVDEGQQTTPEEMMAIVTRIGEECTLVVCGDQNQRDISGESGLGWLISFVERHSIAGVTVHDFNSPSDIVRSGIGREIAIGLMKDGLIK